MNQRSRVTARQIEFIRVDPRQAFLPPLTPFLRISKVLSFNSNHAIIPSPLLNRNLRVPLFCESGKLFSLFDEQDALGDHQIIKCKRVEFALRVNAIKIDVVERHCGAAVLVDERKRWAGNIFGLSGLESFSNAFDHGGLPCPQIAAQQNDAARLEISSQATA